MSGTANILPPARRDAGTPDEQAAYWLAYLYSGEATDEGHGQFSAWLNRSANNARAYRRVQQTWRDMAAAGAEALFPSEAAGGEPESRVVPFERLPGQWSRPGARRGIMAGAMAIAASLVLAVGVWRMASYNPPTIQSYRTAIGEVKTFALPDGSHVTLSADSRIKAIFSRQVRGVELVQGRAWFDIASDPAKPFTVAAAATLIRVVGTQFDVDRSPKDVRVSVARGIVRVAPLSGETGEASGGKSVELIGGQRVTSGFDGQPGRIERFDTANAAPWRTGLLIYRDASLEDVVAEVNRYRTDKIFVAEKSLGGMKITMAIRANQTDALLSGLEATTSVLIDRHLSRIDVRLKH